MAAPEWCNLGKLYHQIKKNNVGTLASGRPQLSSCQTSHLFLQRFLPSGGHLWRRRALAGASLQQVNPGRPRALLVLKVEQDILVQGEELLVPPAVLRRLLAQVSALSPLFTRDQRQKQRVPFVVADALLHFFFIFFFYLVCRFLLEKRMEQSEFSPRAHGLRGLLVNFPTGRRATQRRRGARKSCPADWSASAEELIVKMPESHKH